MGSTPVLNSVSVLAIGTLARSATVVARTSVIIGSLQPTETGLGISLDRKYPKPNSNTVAMKNEETADRPIAKVIAIITNEIAVIPTTNAAGSHTLMLAR